MTRYFDLCNGAETSKPTTTGVIGVRGNGESAFSVFDPSGKNYVSTGIFTRDYKLRAFARWLLDITSSVTPSIVVTIEEDCWFPINETNQEADGD